MPKTSTKERYVEIVSRLAERLTDTGPQALLDLLAIAMVNLSRYSPLNVAMIMAQRPDATDVRGYRTWKKAGKQVLKGERAIWIWAPRLKKTVDENGEEKEVIAGFRLVPVFDITQTDATPEETQHPMHQITAPDHLDPHALARAISAKIAPVTFVTGIHANGLYYRDQHRIEINRNIPPAAQLHALFHEAAHAVLHGKDSAKDKDRKRLELEAETSAYVVSHILGFEVDLASSTYLASYGTKPDELFEIVQDVTAAVRAILAAVQPVAITKAA